MSHIYVVCREYNYDIDKRGDYQYIIFISTSLDESVEYAKSSDWLTETNLHICLVPCSTELDVMKWEKYVVKTLEMEEKINY